MRRFSLCLLLCCLLRPEAAASQEPAIALADEALTDPELYLWRARLLDILARHDTGALFRSLSPGILNSFGGDGGIAEFKERWHLSVQPDSSEVWALLVSLLGRGGRFVQQGEFAGPFYSVASPTPPLPSELDAFETLIVVGHGVNVRAAPMANAPVVTALTLAVVQIDRARSETKDAQGTTWVPIILIAAKQSAWIAQQFLGSAIGYRIGLRRDANGWRIHSLVAGD